MRKIYIAGRSPLLTEGIVRVVSWLDAQSIPCYKQVDPYANSDVPNTLPEWVVAAIADSEQ